MSDPAAGLLREALIREVMSLGRSTSHGAEVVALSQVRRVIDEVFAATPDEPVAGLREAVRQRHQQVTATKRQIEAGSPSEGWCRFDHQDWPCDAAALIAATGDSGGPLDEERVHRITCKTLIDHEPGSVEPWTWPCAKFAAEYARLPEPVPPEEPR